MHTFIVKAEENVVSTYRVQANDYHEAEARVSDMRRLHDGLGDGTIAQIDYQAFSVEAKESEMVD